MLETRKTVPGLRLPDKWAVLIGGGKNHRMGLFDMIMIKDNHIAASGGIEAAVKNAQAYLAENGNPAKIEVETRTMAEVEQVVKLLEDPSVETGAVTRVMLDNMSKEDMRAAVKLIDGRVETEERAEREARNRPRHRPDGGHLHLGRRRSRTPSRARHLLNISTETK